MIAACSQESTQRVITQRTGLRAERICSVCLNVHHMLQLENEKWIRDGQCKTCSFVLVLEKKPLPLPRQPTCGRMFLLAAKVEVVSNFIGARTLTSFVFVQFVSNFIPVAAAQEIRTLLFFIRRLCQTLLFVHIWLSWATWSRTGRCRQSRWLLLLSALQTRPVVFGPSSIEHRWILRKGKPYKSFVQKSL